MRRAIWTTTALATLALVLAGCSDAESEGSGLDGQADISEDTEATLTVWSYNDAENFPYIDRWISSFNDKYPDVTIDWVWTPQEKLVSKLLGTALSGDGPDGIFFDPASAAQLHDGGLLRDLTSYWSEFEDQDQFADAAVSTYEDKTLAVQGFVDISAIWYNKDILDEVGVEPPETIDDFESAMSAVTDAGYEAFTLACEPGPKAEFSLMPWMFGNDANYGQWDQEATTEVFDRFTDWVDQGYVQKDCTNWTGAVAFDKFLAGNVAFAYNGNWNLALANSDADFEYGVSPMPAGSAGSHSVPGGAAVGITQQTEQADLMWEFWNETALTQEGQLAALEASGHIPSRKNLADADQIERSPILQTFTEVVADAGSRPQNPELYPAMEEAGRVFSAVMGGDMSAEEAAEEIEQRTESVD